MFAEQPYLLMEKQSLARELVW